LIELAEVRLDKWLWAARFFKTRSLAKQAIEGGLVHVNHQRCKPAKTIKISDTLEITRSKERYEVIVQGLSERRLSAPLAQALYEETPDSLTFRETEREKRRLLQQQGPKPVGRPSKRDRRQLQQFKQSKN